jgi:hypothetical protein
MNTPSTKAETLVAVVALVLLATTMLFPFRQAVFIREGDDLRGDLGPWFIFARPSHAKLHEAVFRQPMRSDFPSPAKLQVRIDLERTALTAGAIVAVAAVPIVLLRSRRFRRGIDAG